MPLHEGVSAVLNYLDKDELSGLAITVTKGVLKHKIESKNDAKSYVIKYSPDELSLLKRKAITREVLFKYLHDNNVKLSLPATKNDLIKKTLYFWNIAFESTEKHLENDTDEPRNVSVMAQKFTEWFYSMLNSNEGVGPEHFWDDAKITLNVLLNDYNNTEEVNSNPNEIVQLLLRTKCAYDLYFNPNMTEEGVQGRIDSHGLVLVLSCGTLHSSNKCVGVYEQVFGLARDPTSENNWKIKQTELNLRSSSLVSKPPTLKENNLTGSLLFLPSN